LFGEIIFKLLSKGREHIENKREKRRWNRLQELGMYIGKDVYLPMSTWIDISHCYLISIGDRCRFGPQCVILSHDAMANEFLDAGKIGKVLIKESCCFGFGNIILPSVEIGPRVITAAGSVISTSIPPDSVVAGNPARVVASLKDYLRYHKMCLKNSPNFAYTEYGVDNLSTEKRRDLLNQLSGPFGYIVGGYSYEVDKRINPS